MSELIQVDDTFYSQASPDPKYSNILEYIFDSIERIKLHMEVIKSDIPKDAWRFYETYLPNLEDSSYAKMLILAHIEEMKFRKVGSHYFPVGTQFPEQSTNQSGIERQYAIPGLIMENGKILESQNGLDKVLNSIL